MTDKNMGRDSLILNPKKILFPEYFLIILKKKTKKSIVIERFMDIFANVKLHMCLKYFHIDLFFSSCYY